MPSTECDHCDRPLVAFDPTTRIWTAGCKACGLVSHSTDPSVPEAILRTVRHIARQQLGRNQARDMFGLRLFAVGDLFVREVAAPVNGPQWPFEAQWTFTFDHGPECVIFRPGPSDAVVEAFNDADVSFAMTRGDEFDILSVRFAEHIDWVAGTWQPTGQDTYPPPRITQTSDTATYPIVQLLLVDSVTNQIVAIREVQWPTAFTEGVEAAVYSRPTQPSTIDTSGSHASVWATAYADATDLLKHRPDTLTCVAIRYSPT
jgi:hypothetical protein